MNESNKKIAKGADKRREDGIKNVHQTRVSQNSER
jgi:hypothetical protein